LVFPRERVHLARAARSRNLRRSSAARRQRYRQAGPVHRPAPVPLGCPGVGWRRGPLCVGRL